MVAAATGGKYLINDEQLSGREAAGITSDPDRAFKIEED